MSEKTNKLILSAEGSRIEEPDVPKPGKITETPSKFVTWDALADAYREGVESIG